MLFLIPDVDQLFYYHAGMPQASLKSLSVHAGDTNDVTIIQFKFIYDLEISTDISIVQPKSDIHTWIYLWIYLWISISTATLGFGGG